MMHGSLFQGRCLKLVPSVVTIFSDAVLSFLVGALLTLGCSASQDFGTATCAPQEQVQCQCPDGSYSFATCAPNGVQWSACQCPPTTTGTGPDAPSMSGAAAAGGPMAGTNGVQPPIAGSGDVQAPMAGSATSNQPPTTGTGLADAGLGDVPMNAIDAGQSPSGDGGQSPGVLNPGNQQVDSGTTNVQPNPNQDEVPATEHCAPVSDWDPAWTQWEDEVLALTNEQRAKGATCGEYGSFGAAGPLSMSPELRCSARLHSMDMAVRNFFDHTNPDGVDPFTRMAEAGYTGASGGENIAMGQTSPSQVVQGWVGSPGHCRNIMDANFTLIGVGYYSQPGNGWFGGHYWTQNFGGAGFSWPWR